MNNRGQTLLRKFEAKEYLVGVIGLGYVGLPLAVAFARNGVRVIGFDPNPTKVASINDGSNYIADVKDDELSTSVRTGFLQADSEFARIGDCDAVIICVPTPLDQFKKPDTTFIESAVREIGTHLTPGTLISLESTTYPTTTENLLLPILQEESALVLDEDYWLCYSPERVDPGNRTFKTENTPKVLGGLGENATRLGRAMYASVIRDLHVVSSPRAAEMVKILENTYRLVNISLINELALLASRMDIDIWEVIEAAKTKPFGFQPFYPGPGIGGHCIPLDPFYLEYIAKSFDFNLTMINAAGNIDDLMPHRMTVKISFSLNKQRKSINGSKILFIGVAYKPDIADERESPALKIIDEVIHKGGIVEYHDPFIPRIRTPQGHDFQSVPLSPEGIGAYDCIVVTTNHSTFSIEEDVVPHAQLLIDLRNAVKNRHKHVFKL